MTALSKADLRHSMKERVQALDDAQRRASSRAACELLKGVLGEPAGRALLGYLPLPGELDVMACLAWWLQGDGRLGAPVVDWSAGTMVAGALSGLDDACLRIGKHGVREPASDQVMPLDQMDMILVPGLAFDDAGKRLGRGGGFYDRLLAGMAGDVRRIGVCFDQQRANAVPVDAHDQRVDVLVTPAGVVECR